MAPPDPERVSPQNSTSLYRVNRLFGYSLGLGKAARVQSPRLATLRRRPRALVSIFLQVMAPPDLERVSPLEHTLDVPGDRDGALETSEARVTAV